MWVFLSFLSAFSSSGKFIIGKISSVKTDEYTSAFALQFFALILLLPFVVFSGIPKLQNSYWLSLFGLAITVPSWSILYIKAVKLSPLSVCVPMLAFNPIFTALLSIFFDKRLPDALGWFSIFLITIGIYLSRIDNNVLKKGLAYPILSIKQEPGTLAMFLVALIWSIGAHFSKMSAAGSSPLFFAFSSAFIGSSVLYFIFNKKINISVNNFTKNFTHLTSLGISNGLGELTFGAALSLGYTPYVVAIVRSSILWSSLAGILFFKETFTQIKILGLLLMFAGVILLIL